MSGSRRRAVEARVHYRRRQQARSSRGGARGGGPAPPSPRRRRRRRRRRCHLATGGAAAAAVNTDAASTRISPPARAYFEGDAAVVSVVSRDLSVHIVSSLARERDSPCRLDLSLYSSWGRVRVPWRVPARHEIKTKSSLERLWCVGPSARRTTDPTRYTHRKSIDLC